MKKNKEVVIDEILESVWRALEKGDPSLSAVSEICTIPFEEEILHEMVTSGLLLLKDGKPEFTDSGENRARTIIRRHRLTDVLLYHILGYKDHERREKIACETEHNLLPEMAEGICTLLGHPSFSPEGEPIPPGTCCERESFSVESAVVKLASLKVGERARVAYIKPKNHAKFQKLTSFGLIPGVKLQLVMSNPAYVVGYEHTELALDREAVDDIYVTRFSVANPVEDKKEEDTVSEGFWVKFKNWVVKGK
jgi:DtxR family transcriptional regulator, Mn-dependent transcriptional regulator